MQISKYFCISITSISIRHVICTHNAVVYGSLHGWEKQKKGGTRQRAVSFASFRGWPNWLHLLSVMCSAKGSRISTTDADDDPICLSNDATCCATVRATCNMQRATALSRYSWRLMPSNCNRFSASLLPTNCLASLADFRFVMKCQICSLFAVTCSQFL